MNDALRLSPLLPNPGKPPPQVRATALDEVKAIRISPYPDLHCELAQDAVTVPINKALDGGLDDAVELGARAILGRQMKEQMAMHNGVPAP
jgi:hypothetical protein